MSFPSYTEDSIAFGRVSCCSTGKMGPQQGGDHVRGVEFRIPRFKAAPSVSCQIIRGDNASALQVYSLKINDNVAGMTQIAILAQTIHGHAVDGNHYCNIVVIGEPLKA